MTKKYPNGPEKEDSVILNLQILPKLSGNSDWSI